tara:strand:+ start:616 stop:813 length:198 start_codon:yes stop_codon:yes gene_type:complete
MVIHNINLPGNPNGTTKESKNSERDHYKTLEYENYGRKTNEILESNAIVDERQSLKKPKYIISKH